MIQAYERASADATGFVLAGGQSSRMGTDKALVELCGEPLISHAQRALKETGLPVAVAGGRAQLAEFGPVIEDEGGGPLRGICSALGACAARFAVFVAVDTPLLPASLIATLLDHALLAESAVTVASVNGVVETFPVVVDCMMLPALRTEFEAGNARCLAALRAAAEKTGRAFAVLPVENLVQAGQAKHPLCLPAVFWFLNVNSSRELARAEAILAAHRVS